MRVAIVHDWLNGMRGGEKVLEALLGVFPDAPIYTLFHERGKVSSLIESHKIVTSWLNRVPGIYRHYRNLLPLLPSAVESLDLSEFELVISSSHAVAKGIRVGRAKHICYCHTPMRYVWDAEDDYAFDPVRRLAIKAIRPRLQRWDCEAATRVDTSFRIHDSFGNGFGPITDVRRRSFLHRWTPSFSHHLRPTPCAKISILPPVHWFLTSDSTSSSKRSSAWIGV
jgi:hypothetical protein